MKQVNPLDNRVLVKPSDAAERTKGGIFLPGNAREKPSEGVVVAAGEGKKTDTGEVIKMSIKVGDTVIYSKYAGTEIKINDEDHVLLRESDCVATITEVPEPASV